MATITEHEAQQVEQRQRVGKHAGRVRPRPLAAAQQLGPLGGAVRGGRLHGAHARAGPTTPRRSTRPTRTPRCSPTRPIEQVADHFADVIARAGPASRPSSATRSAACSPRSSPAAGCAAVSVAIDPAPFRGVLPLPISALKSASPVLGNPANRNRAVPLTYEQFRYAFANAVSEDEAKELYETYAVPASGRPLFQAATREPQPVDRGQGRHQEPRARPAADHRRREGPHRAVGDRQRLLQEAEAQRGRHRDRRDAEPRPRADDRQRLAGSRRHGAAIRQSMRRSAPKGESRRLKPARGSPGESGALSSERRSSAGQAARRSSAAVTFVAAPGARVLERRSRAARRL